MIIPDVNLLLYATITGFPQHREAVSWWEGLVNGSTPVGLAPPAVFGFLRIATNPRVLETPVPVEAAVEQVRGWLAQPNVHTVTPGPQHFEIALGLLARAGTAGNLTTDAQLAAFAIEVNGQVHSNDTDFNRFPELDWVNPLAKPPGRGRAVSGARAPARGS